MTGLTLNSTDKNSYFRVRLLQVPHQLEDLITGVCFDFGASGVTEALNYVQPDLTYDPDIIPQKSHDLDVYFTEKPPVDFLNRVNELGPQIRAQINEEAHKDWLEEWKKGFNPFKLVSDYWVVPSWHQSPTDKAHTILIDPGMAFGTGTHATTKMASYFVHKLCSQLESPEETSLIDVGTGTAILAMLAQHHGVGHIVGIEIDAEARRVARENIALNQMSEIQIPDELIEEVDETFDIVVANIIDGVLIQIKPHLLRLLNSGGHIFLTGILLEREDVFVEGFIEGSGLNVVRRIEQDEWVGYWLQA